MIPRERVWKTMHGYKPDKLPIVIGNSNTFICQYYGISVKDFLTKPDICAEGNIKFLKEFEIDYSLIVNGYILYGCGPEIGVKWRFPGNNFPGFVESPLKTKADLTKIKIPIRPSGYFKNYLDAIQLVNKAVGKTYHLSVSILGPFAIACFIRGIQEALMDLMLDQQDFFHLYMKLCTNLSIYFGKNILKTGVRNPILNEIFLTAEMIRPDIYHNLVAPYDDEVQRQLGPDNAPNSFKAFMGKPNDLESQKGGRYMYDAFFASKDSLEAIKLALPYSMPGFPFPVTISGRALNSWSNEKLISFLKQASDFLVKENGIYPSISLISVQAESPEKATEIANKINAIKAFRDEYKL